MRVKMILDLIANTKGAKQAQKDVKGVKDAAKSLDGTRAGGRISRDFLNLTSSSKQAVRYLRETKTAANQLGTSTGPKKLSRDFLDLSRNAKTAGREIDQVGRKAARAQARTQRSQGRKEAAPGGRESGKDGGSTLFAGTKAMVGGYLGIQGVRMAGRATVGKSISFEKAMADVIKKVDLPEGQSQGDLERMITGSAIKFGRSREQIAGLAAELGAAGVAYTDLARAIAQATRASVAWDVTPSETGEKLAKIRTQHGMSLNELDDFVDKVNSLADTTASKESDIVEMFQRAAAGAKVADVDRDASLAFLTAMNAGGMQPEIAARGFGAMVSKLRTAKSNGGKKMAEGLKMLDLTPGQVEKGMKTDSLKTLIDLMARFEKSSDKAAVAVKMFGEGWWDEFSRMVQGAPEILKNLRLLNDPKNWRGSSDKTLNIELATTANHFERLKALASDVGDKLGRWALPAINEGIEKIIAGFDALDKRAADRAQARADRAMEDTTAGRVASDQPLTPEERERMATDAAYRKRIQQGAADKRTDKANLGLTNSSRLIDLEQERASLGTSIENRRRAGATEEQLAYSVNRLAAIVEEIRAIDPSRVPAALDPRRPADQDDRANPGRGEAVALLERVKRLEAKLAATEELAATSSNPADRAGFQADAVRAGTRLGSARRPGGQFGFGPGGAPTSAEPKGAGPGIQSFRPSMKNWASSVLGAQDIDLSGIGITLAESLAQGLKSGGSQAEMAAGGIRNGITGAFSGADLSAAGAQMMATLEQGITAGGDRVVAAAQRVAGRARGALAAGGRQSLSGALHDGVE
jgi:TP901 family phage tail tape measure protein